MTIFTISARAALHSSSESILSVLLMLGLLYTWQIWMRCKVMLLRVKPREVTLLFAKFILKIIAT